MGIVYAPQGIRQASRGFQQAAGILDHLHVNVVHKIKTGLSPDLTNESLEMAKGVRLLDGYRHIAMF